MPGLFDRTTLRGMELRNRFVHSATNEGMANEDGTMNDPLIRLREELAEGEVGLIIPGNAYVSEQGKSRPGQIGVQNDATIPGIARMAEAVHRHGSRLVLQLSHSGANMYVPAPKGYALGASDAKYTSLECRAMTKADIQQTVADFAAAAIRAKKAGCDGVQLHGAHSYLLSQFTSPYFNKRTDEYGGSLENRARFVLEVVRAVRSAVGPDYPLIIKVNSDDYLNGGFILADLVPYCLMLEKAGVDAIEVSGGTHYSDPRFFCSRPVGTVPKDQELYFKQAAEFYRRSVRVPLILVGGVRSYQVAERTIASGLADYISMSRPLVREPSLVKRWREGDTRPSTCISCNLCFGPVRDGKGLYCVDLANKRQKKTP